MGHLADRGDALGVFPMVAVGKIQAKGGCSSFDESAEHGGRFRGGADRGHDLGATHWNAQACG
jgi:hypothetical protein